MHREGRPFVLYNPGNDTTGAADLATLTRGSGTLVQVTDPTQLPTALAAITKNLPMQIVK